MKKHKLLKEMMFIVLFINKTKHKLMKEMMFIVLFINKTNIIFSLLQYPNND